MASTSEKYISPYTDFGFKKLFGTEENKDLLRDFLSELISDKGRIVKLTYLTREQLGKNESARGVAFDIHCETNLGEKFIVEMQQTHQKYFKDRSVYYSSFPIQEQALQGEWYYELKPVYFVGILNFELDKNNENADYYHHEVKLMDTNTHRVFYDKLTFIYLEMPKFKKSEKELKTKLDKWLYVLKHLPSFSEQPKKLRGLVFNKLFRVAEIAKLNKVETVAYEASLKVFRDYFSVMKTNRDEGWEEGWKKGREEGWKESREKRRKEDREKRREELLTEIVLASYRKGMSIEQIEIFSGLSRKKIRELVVSD